MKLRCRPSSSAIRGRRSISVTPGAVNGEVVVDLGADGEMTSIITMGSISKLGLAEGSKVTAIVKATNVIMAVKK